MAEQLLPENVTLADLLAAGKVSNPTRYLRLALANMLQAGDFGDITLRIGRTGKGTWPMYLLEKSGDLISRFEGQNHTKWSAKGPQDEGNWSNQPITAADLHDLWQTVTF